MRKKLLSLVMAIAILCVTSVPAFASSTFNCKDDNVEEKMLKLLLSIEHEKENFNEWFNADYGYSYAANISKSFILNQLVAGYPLFGGFCRGNDNYHAVVIRGINTAANTFSVMNPSPTTTGYTAGTISSSGELSFISANSGYTYSLYNAGHYLYVD